MDQNPREGEVIFSSRPIERLCRSDVESLKKFADRNQRKRIRFCSHKNVDDLLHEMFIIHAAGVYVRPHKHRGKAESLYVMEGAADVIIFDDDGGIAQTARLGEYMSGDCVYHRIEEDIYHMLIVRSELFVFHEVTTGPFSRADTISAPWAPDEDDAGLAEQFIEEQLGLLEAFRG